MLFVSCASSLQYLLRDELRELGIDVASVSRHGVHIPLSMENIFKVNYLSRIATRVLLPLAEFRCPDKETLYREARKIDWLSFLDETKTFSIDSHCQHPQIRHSLYAAQLLKDALCDVIREKKGARPSVDTKNPTIQLHLLIHNQKALISFDTSGIALYKRGYREHIGEASLQETLAAAILKKASYTGKEILCDPFCGSGTFLLEAASIASQTPAGFFRKAWGFTHLPPFQEEEWLSFKKEWDSKIIPLEPGRIIGADQNRDTLHQCRENIRNAGFERGIQLVHCPVDKLKMTSSPTLIVTNPPFGKRLEASLPVYKDLGAFLRKECPVAPWAYVLTSVYPLIKATGCPVIAETPLLHGGLHVILYQIANRAS